MLFQDNLMLLPLHLGKKKEYRKSQHFHKHNLHIFNSTGSHLRTRNIIVLKKQKTRFIGFCIQPCLLIVGYVDHTKPILILTGVVKAFACFVSQGVVRVLNNNAQNVLYAVTAACSSLPWKQQQQDKRDKQGSLMGAPFCFIMHQPCFAITFLAPICLDSYTPAFRDKGKLKRLPNGILGLKHTLGLKFY